MLLLIHLPMHALLHRHYIHSISEVIILNNDPHQHKKTATTNNRINSKIKQQHTPLLIGVIDSEKLCFRKCLFVVRKFVFHGQQFSCQTGKGNSQKYVKFSQGVPVWRMLKSYTKQTEKLWRVLKSAHNAHKSVLYWPND